MAITMPTLPSIVPEPPVSTNTATFNDKADTFMASLSAYLAELSAVDSVAHANALDALASKLVWRGTWSNATAYIPNNIVTYNGSSYICILSNTNQLPTSTIYWQVLVGSSPTYDPSIGSVAVTNMTATGSIIENKATIAASDISVSTANTFTKTISANTTFTVSNIPTSGTYTFFVLELVNGGAFTVAWWSGVKWAYGVVPTLTTSGTDILGFYTHDGGTTWRGFLIAKDSK